MRWTWPRVGPGFVPWAAVWVGLATVQVALGVATDRPVGSAIVLFWLVVIAASGCVATSVWLLVRAHLDDAAELGLIGAFAFAVSVLPLVHGLTVPGVLYGPNQAVMSSVMWAVPVAALAAAPLLVPRSRARWLLHWRRWVGLNVLAQTALAVGLLLDPTLLPSAGFGDPLAIVLAAGSLTVCVAFSARHLRLYRISRRASVLMVSLAFASIACGNLVWLEGTPMAAGFWLAHALDIVGVFAVTVVAALAYRRGAVETYVFRPLTVRDPLDALEFGLDPVVREFVADLGRKDPITREHVKRTAETAIALGQRMGLTARDLRTVGLGALLHDVGKLRVDDAVLNKPGRLSAEEFALVQRHAADGEALVRGSAVLAEIAPIVRHHHERIDGRGYPDGLAGDRIPLLARMVSVCDAYDAMVHTRQYREGMAGDLVRSILREHAGSQWDAEVVAAFLEVLDRGLVPAEPTVLAQVGSQIGCSCSADLPTIAAVGTY